MRNFALILTLLFSNPAFSEVAEHTVKVLSLNAPLNKDSAEFSGLSWCGDQLLLLPQYPERVSHEQHGKLFSIAKRDILQRLESGSREPLPHQAITLLENDVRSKMTFFDGYEAIACDGDTLWLSIEAKNLLGAYQAYIVPADIALNTDAPSISIRTDQIRYVESQSGLSNKGDEAIVLHGEQLVSLHEVNDERRVKHPKGNRVHIVSGEQSQIPFEHLPFRITDASSTDDLGRFWVVNYQYSGDRFSRDSKDILGEKYGLGASHQQYFNTERLIEYQFVKGRIARTSRAPIQLAMESKEGRNWEGLVKLDELGFLMITDKYPTSLLGFVSHTPDKE